MSLPQGGNSFVLWCSFILKQRDMMEGRKMDAYIAALIVTAATILCGAVLVSDAYKNPLD